MSFKTLLAIPLVFAAFGAVFLLAHRAYWTIRLARRKKAFEKRLAHMQRFEGRTSPDVSVFHCRDGKCPEGWVLMPGAFRSKNGSTCDACVKPGAPIHVDVLYEGEGISVPMLFLRSQDADDPNVAGYFRVGRP